MSEADDGRATALDEPEAGEVGVPVDAVCTGCKRVAVKRAPGTPDDVETSFKHICHSCKRVTWWNVKSVLHGLLGGDSRHG